MKVKYIFLVLLPLLGFSQIPTYYNTIDFTKKGDELKTQLTTLITNTHTTNLPYTATGTTDVWDTVTQTNLDTRLMASFAKTFKETNY